MGFRFIQSVPNAPWLPAGSTAEMWCGDGPTPEPAIIVRLLTVRHLENDREFFCVSTPKGDDLPTLFLGRGEDRMGTAEGLALLALQTLGQAVDAPCVGFVRNHVPSADEHYPHPCPDAYVPIFQVEQQEPRVAGRWRRCEDSADLAGRHWFPIVQAILVPC